MCVVFRILSTKTATIVVYYVSGPRFLARLNALPLYGTDAVLSFANGGESAANRSVSSSSRSLRCRRAGTGLIFCTPSLPRLPIGRAAIHRARAGVGTSVSVAPRRRRTETRARGWRRTPRDREESTSPPPSRRCAAAVVVVVGDSSYYRLLLRSRRVGRVRMCSFRCGLLINDGWDVQNDDDDDGVQKNALF